MPLGLRIGENIFAVREGRILTAKHFPPGAVNEDERFQLLLKSDGLHIRNLKSQDERVLLPNHAYTQGANTQVTLLQLKGFVCERNALALVIGIVATFVLLAVVFAQPEFAFGAALDLGTLMGASAFVAVTVGAVSWGLTSLQKNELLGSKRSLRYLLAVHCLSALCVYGGYYALDSDGKISERLAQSKTEYFCATKFNHARCVQSVTECPACTKKIVRWKRLKMADNLEASDRQIRAQIAKSQRVPASKKPEPNRSVQK